jgi:hypothetical protein
MYVRFGNENKHNNKWNLSLVQMGLNEEGIEFIKADINRTYNQVRIEPTTKCESNLHQVRIGLGGRTNQTYMKYESNLHQVRIELTTKYESAWG